MHRSLENTPSLSEALIKHPCTKKVTFTGSTRVGKLVAKLAAESGPKKITMELGGNCPFIVFDDADLDQACTQLMALKWRHAGQACISANRIYVQSGVYDKFAEMLRQKTAALVVGHGGEKGTTMGPVTTPRGLDKAEAQAEDAVKKGAKMILGTGKRGGGKKGGYFMEPTILTGMKSDMLMSAEETFAPVAGLYKFETEEEAVRWANDTSMGLASYAFTKNVDRMWRMLENLEAGMVGMVSLIVLFLLDACVALTVGHRILVIRPRQKCHSVVSRTRDTERRAAKTWLSRSISLPRPVHSLSMDSID